MSAPTNATIAKASATATIIDDDAPVTVGPVSMAAATVNARYSQTLTAAGGTAPYTYGVTTGSLPSGLTLSSSGVLSGTPTASGSFSFTVTVNDSAVTQNTASRSYTLAVSGPVMTLPATVLADAVTGQSYSAVINPATGGTAPYSYAVSAGALPSGITVNSVDGSLSGTPTVAGTFAFTITATDSTSGTTSQASRNYSLSVGLPSISVSPATLDAAVSGKSYSKVLTGSGGTSPYSFALTTGTLPAGLTLASDGTLAGTPSATGTFAFAITATDANGATGSKGYSLQVEAPADFAFSPAGGSLPEAMMGEAYSAGISATGGTGTLVYSLASGTLPDGLVLNVSTGQLNGPLSETAKSGDYTFSISVRDSNGMTGSASYTIAVKERAVTVTDKVVEVDAGATPPNVYLNRGATGGPFVDANILAVTPANSGSLEIIRGEVAQAGPVAPVGFYLKFTPNPAFSGQVNVGYRLISALGVSNQGVVTYNVGLNITAVSEDISSLVHGFVQTRQNLIASTIKVPGLLERRRAAEATDPVTFRMSPGADGLTANFSTSLAQMEAARDHADGLKGGTYSPFNIWLNGALTFHNREENGNKWGSFSMLSVGADYLLSEKALIGLSFHYDHMTDPTKEDAELTGNGWLAGPMHLWKSPETYSSIRVYSTADRQIRSIRPSLVDLSTPADGCSTVRSMGNGPSTTPLCSRRSCGLSTSMKRWRTTTSPMVLGIPLIFRALPRNS